jgi:serine/threonine protein kinase/Tfp pilus assembly protein PilF
MNGPEPSRAEATDAHRSLAASAGPVGPDTQAGSGPPPSAPGPLPDGLPASFGRYELRGLLGQGGMGAVYLAHDTQLDRLVALKIPHLDGPDQAAAAERFLREARAAAVLTHPNICPIYDAGRIAGHYYLSMAYIEGQPLSQRLPEGRLLPAGYAAALTRAVALAMQEAHRHGIVHRDLKPANIMLNAHGQPVVMDFGLARREPRPGQERLTQSGVLLGTPAYMAPEQAGGDDAAIRPACDIYSLGVILYELLTGRVPFRAEGIGKLLAQIERDPPLPPSQLRSGLDPELEAVCLKALAKRPQDRFASMGQLAAALAPFAVGWDTRAGDVPDQTIAHHAPRRRRWLLAGLGAVALAGLGAVILCLATNHTPGEVPQGDSPASVPPHVKNDRKSDKTDREEAKGVGRPLSAADRARVAGLLAQGQQLLDQLQFEQLARVADEILRIDPQSPGGLALGGGARVGQGKLEEGLENCQAALKRNPEVLTAYLVRGVIWAARGRPDEAIADATIVLRLAPDHTVAYNNRAHAYLVKGEYRQARADADAALRRNPKRPASPLATRAAAQAMLGDYAKALADYDTALDAEPLVAEWYWQRAVIHARRGDLGKAKADRERAVQLDAAYATKATPSLPLPPQPPAPTDLGPQERTQLELLLGQAENATTAGRYDAAKRAADEILRLDQHHVRALELRANALGFLGRPAEAARDATEAIRLNPESAWGYTIRAIAAADLKDPAGAVADATVALRLQLDLANAYSTRAHAYILRGNYTQAVADATAALARQKRVKALANRGLAYLHLGEYRKALADYDAVVQVEPLGARWYLLRGVIHARLGDLGRASADRARAVQLDPSLADRPPPSLPEPEPPPHRDPEPKSAGAN